MMETQRFNPNEHTIQLTRKQKRSDGSYETVRTDYLPVQWRLVWFREQCPKGVIRTNLVSHDAEQMRAVFKATVSNGEDGSADGYGSESARDFPDYLEKAETKAIGRALAALGYGTQFAAELFEGERIVDAPITRKT